VSSLSVPAPAVRPAVTAPATGWAVVAGQELRDLWLAGRGLIFVFTFSLLLSVLTYLTAANKELNLLDQKDTVKVIMQITLAIGIALSLLLSADAISGERERATLETLLLTPLRSREIAFGKLLATLSIWPVILLISIPYLWVLRTGRELFLDAMASGFVVGTILALGFAALGIIVSTFATSNRVSLAASFFLFIILVAPSQLPGGLGKGWFGELLTRINPVTAGTDFLDKIIVSNHSWSQELSTLRAPIIFASITIITAYFVTARIRLQGGHGG
jgi:ABC-2 type transport system permease protein